MAIKDLAVAYNGSTNANTAVEFAIQMCRKYQATLTGIYVNPPVRFEGEIERWISKDVMENLRQAEVALGQSLAATFRERIAATGHDGPIDWVGGEGQPNTLIARYARYYDLLLIGQFSEPGDANRPVRAEDLVLTSGTPIIIVPNGFQVRPFKEHAVVAWDGSRPAARALSDAMQILETKKRLDILTVSAADREKAEKTERLPNIVTHLERHGIDARHVVLTARREGVGSTILDYCREHEPDVLVMGAYSKARLREDIFGGVTRHVLQNMPVPVMMSH